MRFLLSRRWLIFFAIIIGAAYLAYLLGQWQFHRLEAKHAANARIQHNLAAAPVPVASLLKTDAAENASVEWRRVTIHGTWDDTHTVVEKYQTDLHGTPGIHVATPLVTSAGPAVIVNRGWMQTDNTGDHRVSTPAPQSGPVTVTGWVRVNGVGGAAQIHDQQTRSLSARTISKQLPYPAYQNIVELADQAPADAHALGALEMPDDTGDGPHFFYGLQWWFFGVLAVFGFFYLMYDEWTRRKAGTAGPA